MGIGMLREQARGLNRDQRNAFFAAWLGWAMDAFDYFLLVFVITDVAETFHTSKTHVAVATTLTLAARPVGAAIFGYLADHHGRRPTLLACVLFYSTVGFATAFSTSLTMLLVLRCLYGIGMGGEWGLAPCVRQGQGRGQHERGRADRDHLQHRRDHRRRVLRGAVAGLRPQADDHRLRRVRAARLAAVRVRSRAGADHRRRVPHAAVRP